MRRHILFVALDRFYVREQERRTPALRKEPLVISRDKQVFDANVEARKRGVFRGLPLERARLLMGSTGTILPWKAEDYAELQTRWLDLCVEHSGAVEPEDQHAAYLDLSAHPDPLFVTQAVIDRLSAALKHAIRYGVGPVRWIAKTAALVEGASLRSFCVDDFAELKVELLAPVSEADRQRLHFLGYRKIGDVSRLPLSILTRQFGKEGQRIYDAVNESLFDPVRPSYPPDSLVERMIFESAMEELEPLQSALIEMAQRLSQRLQERQAQATEVIGEVVWETDQKESFSRRFTKPLRCPRSTTAALGLLFSQVFSQPVKAIGVRLPKLEPVRSVQGELILNGKENLRVPRLDSALARVHATFGENSVLAASKIVLPRRERLLKEWRRATGWN